MKVDPTPYVEPAGSWITAEWVEGAPDPDPAAERAITDLEFALAREGMELAVAREGESWVVAVRGVPWKTTKSLDETRQIVRRSFRQPTLQAYRSSANTFTLIFSADRIARRYSQLAPMQQR